MFWYLNKLIVKRGLIVTLHWNFDGLLCDSKIRKVNSLQILVHRISIFVLQCPCIHKDAIIVYNLPTMRVTVIRKAVPPGRDSNHCTLVCFDACEFPNVGNLDSIIFVSWDLRSRSSLNILCSNKLLKSELILYTMILIAD